MLNNNYSVGVMMKGASISNGRASRVKYEEQNLKVRNGANNYQATMNHGTQMHQSPQHALNYHTSNQRVQSPILQTATIKSNKSPVSKPIKMSTVAIGHLGTSLIPEPKSPSILGKSKSPEILKAKPLAVRPQQGLSSYGKN
jgi:hypothetical protein